MPAAIDITDLRFGRIVAIERTDRRCGGVLWRCQCDCGAYLFATPTSLRRGNSTQCRACAEFARTTPAEIRFWAKVDKNGPTQPHMTTPCWVWTGRRLPSGYGLFCVRGPHHREGSKAELAHRFALSSRIGRPLRNKEEARHECDFRPCCRPDHLTPGSHAENMADAVKRGRSPRGEQHGSAKLTNAEASQIRERRAAGESLKQLARYFGVRESTVSRIANGVRRSHT